MDFPTYLLLSHLKKIMHVLAEVSALLVLLFVNERIYIRQKLDPYLPVRIFGNFMHPAVVVKNLAVWFDANFSTIFVRHASVKFVMSGGLDST